MSTRYAPHRRFRFIHRVALGAALTLASPLAAFADPPAAVEVRLLNTARDMGRDLASFRDQFDDLLVDFGPIYAELQRLDGQIKNGAPASPDAAAALEQRKLELHRRIRQSVNARLEPMLPRVQALQTNNRARLREALHAPAHFERFSRAWLKGDRSNSAVLMLATHLATVRLGQQAFALYQSSLVGEVQDVLSGLKRTLHLIHSVTASDASPDEYNRALDDLLSGAAVESPGAVDSLDALLDSEMERN